MKSLALYQAFYDYIQKFLAFLVSGLLFWESTNFWVHNFRKDWSTCTLKNFCHSSYIFGNKTHFLADKRFLIWHSNTLFNTTPQGSMVYSIDVKPFYKLDIKKFILPSYDSP